MFGLESFSPQSLSGVAGFQLRAACSLTSWRGSAFVHQLRGAGSTGSCTGDCLARRGPRRCGWEAASPHLPLGKKDNLVLLFGVCVINMNCIPWPKNPAQQSNVFSSHVLKSVLSGPEPVAGPRHRHFWLESHEAVPGPLVQLLSMP